MKIVEETTDIFAAVATVEEFARKILPAGSELFAASYSRVVVDRL